LIGFDTLEAHAVVHGPVVILAVFTIVPVAEAPTVPLMVTVAVCFGARVTLKVQVLPVGFTTVHVSGLVTAQDGEFVTVSCDGIPSVTTAEPPASPTFSMTMV
jgi:hypothetical protein